MSRETTSSNCKLHSTNKVYVITWSRYQEELAIRVERKDMESGSLVRRYDCTLAGKLVLGPIS